MTGFDEGAQVARAGGDVSGDFERVHDLADDLDQWMRERNAAVVSPGDDFHCERGAFFERELVDEVLQFAFQFGEHGIVLASNLETKGTASRHRVVGCSTAQGAKGNARLGLPGNRDFHDSVHESGKVADGAGGSETVPIVLLWNGESDLTPQHAEATVAESAQFGSFHAHAHAYGHLAGGEEALHSFEITAAKAFGRSQQQQIVLQSYAEPVENHGQRGHGGEPKAVVGDAGPSDLVLANLTTALPSHPLIRLMPIADGSQELVAIKLPSAGNSIGRTLSELRLPYGTKIVLIITAEGQTKPLDSDAIIEAEDEIIALFEAYQVDMIVESP